MTNNNYTPNNNRKPKKRTEDITVEELKALPCYQETEEAELQSIVEFVKGFCELTFEIWKRTDDKGLNKSINMNQSKQNKAA